MRTRVSTLARERYRRGADDDDSDDADLTEYLRDELVGRIFMPLDTESPVFLSIKNSRGFRPFFKWACGRTGNCIFDSLSNMLLGGRDGLGGENTRAQTRRHVSRARRHFIKHFPTKNQPGQRAK